ncbi:MAG: LuxR family transcriptional regulator [Marinirhabdus sp.]|nr:LuxR family transcriptional regulator [Marinirhabdus sp.]
MKYVILHSFLLLLIIGVMDVQSQELPPILNYKPSDYLAGNQNWALTQDKNNIIYIANNDGLLEFNGERWNIYPAPNKSIVRSVLAVDDLVYSGCYMDFGYWEETPERLRKYHSLSDSLGIQLLEDEQFWNILTYQEWVLFQSLNRIYFYNTLNESVRFIESNDIINKMFSLGDEIYYQVLNQGLFSIEKGQGQLLSDAAVFKDDIITSLFEREGQIFVVTRENGIFYLSNNQANVWRISAAETLEKISVYTSLLAQNRNLILGTIANGIYILSPQGDIINHIYQVNGLNDNTALSLFQDANRNIWIGLDNGVDCVNLNTPFSNYTDRNGRIGTVYTAIHKDDFLYLGTNQGLFYRVFNSDQAFQFIEGTEGQVWSLTEIDDTLFCGHNSGTFVVKGTDVQLISKVMGTWGVKRIPNNPNLLLQGNYDGLHILEKQQDNWRLRNKLEGFDIASKHFEISNTNEILVSHEYKGVYRITPSDDFYKLDNYVQLTSVEKGAASGLIKFDGRILYANENGVFYYNDADSTFKKEAKLSTIISEDQYISGAMVAQENDKLWLFTQNYINYVTKDKINNTYQIQKIPIKETLRDQMRGYENIASISENTYLLGTSSGYLLMDLEPEAENTYAVSINSIVAGTSAEDAKAINFQRGMFKPNQNYIQFHFGVPIYQKYLQTEYQYRLLKDGVGDWVDWTSKAAVAFQNLGYGNYAFEVKAKVNNRSQANPASYSFEVDKPWYVTNVAIMFYVLGGILLFFAINTLYSSYFKKQSERLLAQRTRELKLKELESQKEIIQLKNESLNQDISARNRELAVSTMSTIKKNEALNSIKVALKKIPSSKEVENVVKLIDETMNDIKDWKYFEEAFNSADKNFFKKVKEKHPELTANDLRLCVYLRLNLSSKEIAPLLNISTRSVEIKRYRLRKKIDLNKEVKLNDYFMNL